MTGHNQWKYSYSMPIHVGKSTERPPIFLVNHQLIHQQASGLPVGVKNQSTNFEKYPNQSC